MLIYAIEISKTASAGAWSFNTPKFDNAILKQIILKATTATTTFDPYLTDDHNNNPLDTSVSGETPTGTFNISGEKCDIPLKGIYTIGITNSSAEEAYTGRLLIQEEA